MVNMYQENGKILITSKVYLNNSAQEVNSRKAKNLLNINYIKQSIKKTWKRDKIVMYSSSHDLLSSCYLKREVLIYQGKERLMETEQQVSDCVQDPQLVLLS